MTDTAKLTVSFTQKVSEAPYETADYTLSIERSVPESMGDEGILAEATALFETVKTEVLRQSGQEIDLSPDGVVMRRLKSGVSRSSDSQASAPTQAAPSGPTATSVAAAPAPAQAAPAGGKMTGRVYKRVDFCLGKNAEQNQTAFNLLAFQPNEWADENGGTIKVYEVKEKADGTTDVTKTGKNFPNFSVSKDALARLGMQVARDVGIWVNDGDSNVPLKVWDQASGQTQDDAIEWDWLARREELQAFAYKGN
ncbi:MAG: hypothetical protein CMG34_08180 [Candidatus Marinimicrobia bacterium]|nr:hypothetical protein [Candidatus Neomarinimicrobiota bacterium]MBP01176.1 hypothetical protein [Candidatus Neomarinimicrobiota bacterium]|tara:strand:+ start:1169 stop:1927 length:759 start_codon:yes stop_codon:yes gene_type:complete